MIKRTFEDSIYRIEEEEKCDIVDGENLIDEIRRLRKIEVAWNEFWENRKIINDAIRNASDNYEKEGSIK